MRKWILLALLVLLFFVTFKYREGVDSTLSPPPSCSAPDLSVIDGLCKKPDVQPTPPTCPPGTTVGLGGTKCYGPDTMTAAQAAAAGLTYSNITQKYSKDVSPTCPAGYKLGGLGGCTYENPLQPTCASGFTYSPESGTCSATSVSYAESTGYADLAASVQDANNGPLPSAIDERASSGDTDTTRPLNGDVFGANGPFSGQLGTGQGTGTAAAAVMNGNTYGPPGQTVTLAPFDLWKGTKGSKGTPTMPGTKMPVDGPTWGGVGSSTMSRSATSSQPAPALYGPVGSGARGADTNGFGFGGGSVSGWGYSQKNSVDTSMLPSGESTGSEPSNAYAVTSRVPGDMDMFPFPYIQSSSYSLANGSMKTDPVPFLTDFSAFQN